ncbi:hypothetical protein AX16_006914 [Volvariella volvacea WC 439]|nr:hypothetical protein AX16_006914 [Volvariella volvacea WC 439]
MSGNEAEPTNALTSGKPTRSQLPGFGLPVNHAPEGFTFPNSTDLAQTGRSDSALPPLMLREIAMLQIMNLITDKPEWDKKVFNDEIVSKWKEEALADSAQSITPAMMEWCIHELRYRAPIYQKTGHIRVINGDVVKSDIAVPAALKLELRDAVRPLEDVPDKDKDWHPGSDEKVLDLVHPSLFPLVYGRTRVLEDSLTSLEDCVKRCGQGKIAPVPKEEETQQKNNRYAWQSVPYVPFSARFQWLPCEVQISKDEEGKVKSKITSYINNLHPAKFPRLYQIVEEIISCAIPLWNSTLTPLKYEWRDVPWPRIEYSIVQYYWADSDDDDDDDDDEEGGEGEGEVEVNSEEGGESEAQARAGSEEGGQADDGDDDDDDNSENDGRILVVPDAPEWTGPKLAPENEVVDLVKDYGNRGLQIIVKLANIHLTPEKPRYEGGTWHVEGRLVRPIPICTSE